MSHELFGNHIRTSYLLSAVRCSIEHSRSDYISSICTSTKPDVSLYERGDDVMRLLATKTHCNSSSLERKFAVNIVLCASVTLSVCSSVHRSCARL